MRLNHTSQLTKVILIVEFVLLAYLLYALTVNVYRSYKLDLHIQNFEKENAAIAAENEAKANDFVYFNSQQYVDRITKQSFGRVNPGEEVIVLTPEPENVVSESTASTVNVQLNAEIEGLSVPEQWWKFFFDR